MPLYEYKVMNQQGKQQKGVYTAQSVEELYVLLKQQGFFPLEVQEKTEDTGSSTLSFNKPLGGKSIAIFCRQFHTMLDAGVPIIQCLDILHQQTEHKKLKLIIGEVFGQVQQGFSLSESFSIHQPMIPSLLVHMIEAGEVSGNLDVILERMAHHYEKEYKLSNKIKNAMIYPLVLSIVAIGVVLFLLTFVMPTFMELFSGSGVELPGPTQLLLKISDVLQIRWYWILGTMLIIIGAFMYSKTTTTGRKILDTILLKTPIIGKTNRIIIVSRFTRTLSTLLSSGVPLLQAMDISAKIVNNAIAEEELLKAKEEVQKGMALSEPLKSSTFFPPMMTSMVQIGEESGALEELLDKTANFYDEESEAALQRLTTMIEPIMIVMMAGIIGFIVIAMLLPMFDMMNVVQM